MHAKELLELERRDIRALHYTWIAFFSPFMSGLIWHRWQRRCYRQKAI